ncbi:MAG TPA: MBL fold metallo-hydrolase [Candidatus Limnocylindrales bacterium]|nr:MBL fold metallo-hydrolase [Candidatus Limnocylindrales bacterium]
MREVTITFAGSGDAFGSGGRLQACIHLRAGSDPAVLLDCGATALVGLKRLGLEPNEVGTVVLSHLHGDHFAGVPYLILDGQFRRRTGDLDVVGPPGTEERLRQAMEVLFPGASGIERRFEVRVHEVEPGSSAKVEGLLVTAFRADHFAGDPSLSLRLELGGRVIGYSGDTAWTTELRLVAMDTDLFICEGYSASRRKPFHLHLPDLDTHLDKQGLDCQRIILTHPSEEVLAMRAQLGIELADDGTVLKL